MRLISVQIDPPANRTCPANQPHSVQSPTTPNQYNLLRNKEAPLLIQPKCTEPYYTKPV